MTKKRHLPHGRSMSKAKKERPRAYTPANVSPIGFEGEPSDGNVAAEPSFAPFPAAPRSAIRYGPPRRASRSGTGLITDYRYVRSDLRRIAMLAGGTFVILAALAFVIH